MFWKHTLRIYKGFFEIYSRDVILEKLRYHRSRCKIIRNNNIDEEVAALI